MHRHKFIESKIEWKDTETQRINIEKMRQLSRVSQELECLYMSIIDIYNNPIILATPFSRDIMKRRMDHLISLVGHEIVIEVIEDAKLEIIRQTTTAHSGAAEEKEYELVAQSSQDPASISEPAEQGRQVELTSSSRRGASMSFTAEMERFNLSRCGCLDRCLNRISKWWSR